MTSHSMVIVYPEVLLDDDIAKIDNSSPTDMRVTLAQVRWHLRSRFTGHSELAHDSVKRHAMA